MVACYKALPRRSRSRHVLPWNSQISIEEYSKVWSLLTLCRNRKTQESKRSLEFRKETKLWDDCGAHCSRMSSTKCAYTHEETRNPTRKHLTPWQLKDGFTSLLLASGLSAETNTRACNPTKEEAATPQIKTEEHLEYTQIAQSIRDNVTRQSSVPDAEQWSSWSSWRC